MPMKRGAIMPKVRVKSEAAIHALVGERFGLLTVVGLHGWSNGHVYVACRCDCGEIKAHRPCTLKHRNGKRSCGCKGLTAQESEARDCFRDLVRGAAERGIDVGIAFEQARDLYLQPCSYCGRVGVNPARSKMGKRLDVRLNGIDRIDSDRGYVEGNIAACCCECNFAKRTLTAEAFIQLCRLVTDHCAPAQQRGG